MIIKVIAKPNSKIDKIEWKNNELHLKIKAKPIDGEANSYIIDILAEKLKTIKSNIFIKSGHNSKIKYIEINLDDSTWGKFIDRL